MKIIRSASQASIGEWNLKILNVNTLTYVHACAYSFINKHINDVRNVIMQCMHATYTRKAWSLWTTKWVAPPVWLT